ncbi:major capsid protein [Xanthomonas phage Xoo-sp13]|nr:major capsid protein [Xanthomonas phage Xoo-sp13]
MSTELLTTGWQEAKSALLEGLSPDQKSIVAPLLENQKSALLNETASAGAVQTADIANFRKTLLPMIRRIIPGTIATELVGVQPMSGPVSQAYTMRYTYAEDAQHAASRSLFGGYDIVAGDEAFGNAKPIRQFYSGTIGTGVPAGSSGLGPASPGNINAATGQGTAWGSPAADNVTSYDAGTMNFGAYSVPVGGSLLGGGGGHLESSGGRKMSLKVISQAVEAGSRKLQAGWTIEAMQDLNSQHGLDLESEMTKVLSAEIVQELDSEIIQDLYGLAGTVRTFDFNASAGGAYAPAWSGDRYSHLAVYINEIANEIARKTRRGAANYIVVSPVIVSILQSAAKAVFAPAVAGSFKGPNNTMLVGTLNGTIKVYSYIWNQEQLGASATNRILLGYKGGNGETDAGYFYCPYIPLMASGVVLNADTYNPSMSLMTRYAKLAFTDPTTSLGNSADYYGRLNVLNLSQV